MAISRERLQELINEGATIYYSNECSVDVKVLSPSKYECDSGYLWVLNNSKYTAKRVCGYDLERLFETQKKAEWQLKYHATRTEELKLPTWEDFKNSKVKWISFWSKYYDNYWLYLRYNKIRLVRVLDDDYEITEQTWKATEENYIKACDLCIKLFKGEEE